MNREAAMKSSKRIGDPSMSAAISATDRARFMVLNIGGPRPFGDTKESWCARVARKLALTPRRVRALLSNSEKIRLSADEYVRIEALYLGAGEAVEALQRLASEADLRAHRLGGEEDGSREALGGRAGQESQRATAGAAVRQAR
jgi:hypothetical protein